MEIILHQPVLNYQLFNFYRIQRNHIAVAARIGIFVLLFAVTSCFNDDKPSGVSIAVDSDPTVDAKDIPASPTKQANSSDTSNSASQPSELNPEPILGNDSPTPATPSESLSADSIVEQFGFSTVDNLATASVPASIDLYCLDGSGHLPTHRLPVHRPDVVGPQPG